MEQEQAPGELTEEDFDLNAETPRREGKAHVPPDSETRVLSISGGPLPRVGSMATVRVRRRTKLALKLKEVFDLDDIEEVLAGQYFPTELNASLTRYYYRDALLVASLCPYVNIRLFH